MIFQKHYNTRGMILVDIILAISVGLILTIVLSESSTSSREIFYKSRERNLLLDAYHQYMNTGTSGSSIHDYDIQNSVIPYGNDMDEKDTVVMSSSSEISFTSVAPISYENTDSSVQYPICSVDFTNTDIIGSYNWYRKKEWSSATEHLSINLIKYILPINQSIPLTDIEVRNDIAYISGDSSTTLDPDLFVFRIDHRGHADLVSYINTGPGLVSLSVIGKYIYGASPSKVGQLHIMMQSSQHGLSLVKRYELALPYATATPALGTSISYANNTIYLGTEKWIGEELVGIDISNPTSPSILSGHEIGSKVNAISIFGKLAYVSTPEQKQLQVFDIGGSGNIIPTNSFSPSGWQRQEGTTVSLFENGLSFGRTTGGYNISSDHELFVFSTTSTQTLPFPLQVNNSIDMPGGVYGIMSDRFRKYMITRQSGSEFQIFDNTLSTATSLHFSLPSLPQAMTCYRDKIYILSHTKSELYEISIEKN